MASLLIRGGRVVSPADDLDAEVDVLVDNGAILEIGPGLDVPAATVLDAEGQIVAPGFIDIHVHLREPGGEASETLETGLRAAVAGGLHGCLSHAEHKPCERLSGDHAPADRKRPTVGAGAGAADCRSFKEQRKEPC